MTFADGDCLTWWCDCHHSLESARNMFANADFPNQPADWLEGRADMCLHLKALEVSSVWDVPHNWCPCRRSKTVIRPAKQMVHNAGAMSMAADNVGRASNKAASSTARRKQQRHDADSITGISASVGQHYFCPAGWRSLHGCCCGCQKASWLALLDLLQLQQLPSCQSHQG